ncbi:MAG: FkbM family methyltransferase [Candidatus Staskawiczbacteria bacterium]|nr:FkbM family methyltransferase [Candidatus Staskawiczbacteria bacterium]
MIYFRLKYPLAKIYAFEPDTLTFQKLQKNTNQFKDNIMLFNFALSDREGTDTFFSCYQSSVSSSLMKKSDTEECKEIIVQTRSLDSAIKQIGITKIDLLKFDIEGAEFKVFKHSMSLDIISHFIGELHLDLVAQNITKNDFLSIFKAYRITFKKDYKKRAVLEMNK